MQDDQWNFRSTGDKAWRITLGPGDQCPVFDWLCFQQIHFRNDIQQFFMIMKGGAFSNNGFACIYDVGSNTPDDWNTDSSSAPITDKIIDLEKPCINIAIHAQYFFHFN